MSLKVHNIPHYGSRQSDLHPAPAQQLHNGQFEVMLPHQRDKIRIQPADVVQDDCLSNRKSRKPSQVGHSENCPRKLMGSQTVQYSRYRKHVKNRQQSQIARLRSKLNFILNAGRDPDQEATVSYYNQSSRSSARGSSLSSVSIQSNKRLMAVQKEKAISPISNEAEKDAGKREVHLEQQRIKNDGGAREQQNEFLANSFVEKKQKSRASKFIFFGQPEKQENIKEANKKECRRQQQGNKNNQNEQLKIKPKTNETQSFKQENFPEQNESQKIKSPERQSEAKVIFAEDHQLSFYDFQVIDRPQDTKHLSQCNIQSPLAKQKVSQNRSVSEEKSFKSKHSHNQNILTQSLDKSKDSKLKNPFHKEFEKDASVDGMEELLNEINKQEQGYKSKEYSIDSRRNDLTDRYEELSNQREMKLDAVRKLKSSQQNHYDIAQRRPNLELQRVGSMATDRIDLDDLKSSKASSHFKRREAETLNLKPRLQLAKKRNSQHQILNNHPQKHINHFHAQKSRRSPDHLQRQNHPVHLDLKKQLENELIHDEVPINRVDFKVQLKKRLKTEADQKESKKFTAILKKREQALAKKVREQLQTRPRQLLYEGSTVSKQSSLREIQRQQLSTPQLIYHHSYLTQKSRQTERNHHLPSIDASQKPLSIRQSKTSNHDYENLNSIRRLNQNAEQFRRHRLKSDENSSNSEKVSFQAESIRFTNPALLQSGKVSYRNLSHYWKETKSKNTSAKEKFQRLKKLLGQI